MTRIRTNLAVFILVGGVCLSGNQSALTKIGITVKDVQTWATQAMIESTDVEGSIIRYRVPCVSPSAVKVLQVMTPAERLALTQEALAAAKAAVSTPAFKAEHAGYVKQTRNAIDHGIADTEKLGLTGNTNADAIKTMIVPIIDMLRTFPFDALKQSYIAVPRLRIKSPAKRRVLVRQPEPERQLQQRQSRCIDELDGRGADQRGGAVRAGVAQGTEEIVPNCLRGCGQSLSLGAD